jgi:hypothetical protein
MLLNLNSTDVEITNYCVYKYNTYTYIHIYILPLNRLHIKAAIISSEWCKWPSTEITFFSFQIQNFHIWRTPYYRNNNVNFQILAQGITIKVKVK